MAYRWELTNEDGQTKFSIMPKKKTEKRKKKKKRENKHIYWDSVFESEKLWSISCLILSMNIPTDGHTFIRSSLQVSVFRQNRKRIERFFLFFFHPLLFSFSLFLSSIYLCTKRLWTPIYQRHRSLAYTSRQVS